MNGADQSDCSSCTAVKRSVAFFRNLFPGSQPYEIDHADRESRVETQKKPEFKLEGKHVGNRLIFHRKTARTERTHGEKHVQVGSTSQFVDNRTTAAPSGTGRTPKRSPTSDGPRIEREAVRRRRSPALGRVHIISGSGRGVPRGAGPRRPAPSARVPRSGDAGQTPGARRRDCGAARERGGDARGDGEFDTGRGRGRQGR